MDGKYDRIVAENLNPIIRELLAQAWEEGYDDGLEDGIRSERGNDAIGANPYRVGGKESA
jgi:hypothetical protein